MNAIHSEGGLLAGRYVDFHGTSEVAVEIETTVRPVVSRDQREADRFRAGVRCQGKRRPMTLTPPLEGLVTKGKPKGVCLFPENG